MSRRASYFGITVPLRPYLRNIYAHLSLVGCEARLQKGCRCLGTVSVSVVHVFMCDFVVSVSVFGTIHLCLLNIGTFWHVLGNVAVDRSSWC